jgi:hypothetical protein
MTAPKMPTSTGTMNAAVRRRRVFSWWHLLVLVLIWFPLNPAILLGGSMLLHHRVLLYFYTIFGPFIDIIGRGPTPTRLTEALTAFVVFGIPLMLSCAVQYLWNPKVPFARFGRLVIWAVGWFVWFLGATRTVGQAMG